MKYSFLLIALFIAPLVQAQSYSLEPNPGRFEAGALLYRTESPGAKELDFSELDNPGYSGWQIQKSVQMLYLPSDSRVSLAIQVKAEKAGLVYIEYPGMMEPGTRFDARVFSASGPLAPTLIRSSKPVWELNLEPGNYLFVLQYFTTTGAVPMRFYLRDAHEMVTSHARELQVFSLIYGIGLAYIVFNLAMFGFFRQTSFIYYAAYSATLLYALAAASGHIPIIRAWLWFGAILLNLWFACLMSDSVLSIKEKLPRVHRAIFYIMGLATVIHYAIVGLELHPDPLRFSFPIAMIAIGLCVYSAIVRMMAGYAPAAFFAAGWTVLIIGYGLNFLGLAAPKLIYLSWSSYIAYATESLFFAIALAYRTRDTERTMEKERIHALSQLQKIVYPHQIESIKQGSTLEQTMPTGAGRACVIAFDIVGSSKIQHVRAAEFFHNVFRRCYEAMMEGYDGTGMRASAFRIKEMGDGFLCSVGYPFQSMSANPANDALHLALKFAAILQEESPILQADEPPRCGIGIALDSLSGFYPQSGTKEYDLYGQAIVLATRYESMRKSLFEGELTQSVVILQERVYLSLDRNLREDFQVIELADKGLIVRDDPGATRLYTRFLDSNSADRAWSQSA